MRSATVGVDVAVVRCREQGTAAQMTARVELQDIIMLISKIHCLAQGLLWERIQAAGHFLTSVSVHIRTYQDRSHPTSLLHETA